MLEGEVRELKDLLDEKDEKIDMLSAMHGNMSGGPRRKPSVTSMATPVSPDGPKESPTMKEDTFRVQATQLLLGVENSDSYFMGSSSGRAFIGMSYLCYLYAYLSTCASNTSTNPFYLSFKYQF